MKNHDTDNDFLDDLYAHSAKEAPPVALDEVILKQARDNMHKRNFVSRSQWQQLFSVAAVIVLSVYFVFDMGDQSLDMSDFSHAEERTRFSDPVFETEHAPRMKEPRLKVEKSKAKEDMGSTVYESNSISDDSSISGSQSVRIPKSSSSEAFSYSTKGKSIEIETKEISIDKALPVTVNDDAESLMATADEMVEEIEKLMAEGKLVAAKEIYNELSDTYPKYPVPIRIVEALSDLGV